MKYLILLFALFSSVALANTATLTLTPPTVNADNTPLTDLAGFKYYGALQGAAKTLVGTVNSPTTLTFVHTLTAKEGSTWCYQATAFDTSGNESSMSNEACKPFPNVPPAAPTITSVVTAMVDKLHDPAQFVADNLPPQASPQLSIK